MRHTLVNRVLLPPPLSTTAVSRFHAKIHMEAAGGSQYRVRVVDRGSCNGTFINEEPVLESGPGVVLANNDILRFGDAKLVSYLHIDPRPHMPTHAKNDARNAQHCPCIHVYYGHEQ